MKVLALLLLGALGASGHDFWIEPARYRGGAGDGISLRLRVGMDFDGEPVARSAKLTKRFFAVGPNGEQPVPGMEGMDPAGVLKPFGPGIYTIGYRSTRKFIELPAATFDEYLHEEGIEGVTGKRTKLGESEKPGREWYSRCAKSLIAVGEGAEGFDRDLGFPLELTPETNPFELAPGGEMRFRLLYQGKPLVGALVDAHPKGKPEAKLSGRTDAEGRVRFRLPLAGAWLIAAVHMERTASGSEADWESWWASLTFSVGSGEKAGPPIRGR